MNSSQLPVYRSLDFQFGYRNLLSIVTVKLLPL